MQVRIDRVETRDRLKCRREPYWYRLGRGRSVGYRKLTQGRPGTWIARIFDGANYPQQPLGDFATTAEKDRFDIAKRAAEEWFAHMDTGGTNTKTTVKE